MIDAGLVLGRDIALGVDVAVNSIRKGHRYRWGQKLWSVAELITLYQRWFDQYLLISIQDGLDEDDWSGWQNMTKILGNQCQLVGGDIFVTQMLYLTRGICERTANGVLVKFYQVGTVMETRQFPNVRGNR